MQLSLVLALAGLVSAVPMPEVKVVYVTEYSTVYVDGANPATPTNTIAIETGTVEPAPEQTEVAAETASTSTVEPSTTSVSPKATSATSTTSTGTLVPSGDFSGKGTYYDTGLGACGWTNQDSDYIVAVSHFLYEPETINGNSNNNNLCGKMIRASYEGKSVDVKVVDECMGCAERDLDFSPSAFSQIADKDLGRIDITWEWL
jgi:expansin (peptidoglycan-binding protein)